MRTTIQVQGRAPSDGPGGGGQLAGLEGRKYCLLTTFRRSGAGVETPVWFAAEGRHLYVKTAVDSGKVKRIGKDTRVRVAPCTLRGKPLGPAIEGSARVVSDPEVETRAERAFAEKYGLGRPLILGALHLFGVRELYVEIVPSAR